ncbi:MAG: DUF4407 domain-containing protein [Actinomycetales bacterium]
MKTSRQSTAEIDGQEERRHAGDELQDTVELPDGTGSGSDRSADSDGASLHEREIEEIHRLLAEAEVRDREQELRPRERTFGSQLRSIAGANDRLIDDFPTERTRYTAMGGIVLGTACIAATSMWFAVANALQEAWYVATFVAVVWGAFILNLDRWLMASMSRSTWQSNMRFILPRLAIAVIFAFIIAEPLVLRLFSAGIEQEIRDVRIDQNRINESMYRACNPGSVGVDTPEGCENYIINVNAPSAQVAEVQNLQKQVDQQSAELARDRAALQQLEEVARAECNGTPGEGLSGRPGEGPNCMRNRESADAFARSANLDARQSQLEGLRAQLAAKSGEVGEESASYQEDLTKAIDQKIKDEYVPPDAKMGLIERFAALGSLSRDDPLILSAQWAIRILFITIECLPVLVKLMSGRGPYDQARAQRQDSAARLAGLKTRALEEQEAQADRLKLIVLQKRMESAERTLDLEEKVKHAQRRSALDRAIAESQRRLLDEQARRRHERRVSEPRYVNEHTRAHAGAR